MPIVSNNIKNYFEILNDFNKNNNIFEEKENNKGNMRDIDIIGLFPDQYVNSALQSIDDELRLIQSISRESIKRNSNTQSINSLELIMTLYRLHGSFKNELCALKYYQKISDIKLDMEEKNYGLAIESFWHFIHDNKVVIPPRSVDLCKKIIINEHSRKTDYRFFIMDLAKLMFNNVNPEYEELLDNIKVLRNKYNTFFEGSSLDSYLSRAHMYYYTFILQIKAERMNLYNKNFNHLENTFIMRKVALKVLEYLKKKNSNLNMLAGSYETVFYMWTFVNVLLTSLHYISEVMTIMGMDREAKRYQYEYFRTSVIYCVPHRTRFAIKLMMHNEYISQRVLELTIRDAQLHFLKTNDVNNSLQTTYRNQQSEIDEFNLPLMTNEFDIDYATIRPTTNNKPHQRHSLYIVNSENNDRETLLNLEDCFLSKSTWKNEFLDILKLIKSFIWKVNNDYNDNNQFCDDNEWEKMFITPENEDDNDLSEFLQNSLLLKTPENSPVKTVRNLHNKNNNCPPINCAPVRAQRRQLPMGLTKIKPLTKGGKDDGDMEIDSCSTVVIPHKARNIHYEMPIPRSLTYNEPIEDCSPLKSSPKPTDGTPSIIDYLQKHVDTFRYFNIPVLHRPVFQRLALHYLSKGDQLKAAFNFSLAINIGFRQSYQYDCDTKIRSSNSRDNNNSKRWSLTKEVGDYSLLSEGHMRDMLGSVLPVGWTVLQFSMIDEIAIGNRVVKSSLLDGVEGGCLGARNVAVMVVTKYQNKKNGEMIIIENRVIHGFKTTGLQLMENFEKLKMDNINSLGLTVRKEWWAKRFSIDIEIERMCKQMGKDWFTEADLEWLLDNNDTILRSEPKILITDRHLSRIPFECIFTQDQSIARCFSRMPNLFSLIGHLTQIRFRKIDIDNNNKNKVTKMKRVNLEVDPLSAFFLINPDSTLQRTEDTLLPMFKEKLHWDGICGAQSSTIINNNNDKQSSVSIINNKDMTIYCGHGSGSKYLQEKLLKQVTSPSALFLIGCYSARFLIEGRGEATSLMSCYLSNGCPSVLGLQWDVTDKEIDKYTQQMFQLWLTKQEKYQVESDTYKPVAPLSSYLHCKETSEGLRLKTLTGKSAIVFGLPIWVDTKREVPDLACVS